MFDYENPFKEDPQPVEEIPACDPTMMEEGPGWENADWEEVCNNPQHKAEGAKRAARTAAMEAQRKQDREELFSNFYENGYRRRRERTLIKALRYGALAIGCSLLTYVCCEHSINWLAWVLGSAGVVLSIVSGYGFGIAREMSR